MASTDQIIPCFSIHAIERYRQRIPSHFDMYQEWITARTASNKQLQLIRRFSIKSAEDGKVATKGSVRHYISKNGCVFVVCEGASKNHVVVVTIFRMPKHHHKTGCTFFNKGKMLKRSGKKPMVSSMEGAGDDNEVSGPDLL